MDQEGVTLAPPGGIERTVRSIEILGSTKGIEQVFPKLERHSTKWNDTLPRGTIQDKIETIQTNIVTEGMLGRVLS